LSHITVGPGPNPGQYGIWFLQSGAAQLWRIDPSDVISATNMISYTIPAQAGSTRDFTDLIAASDGTLWFTQSSGNIIWRFSPGDVSWKQYPLSQDLRVGYGLVPGADGQIWFDDDSSPSAIVRMSADGTITHYDLGIGIYRIAAGVGGELWFIDNYQVARITPTGSATAFGIPTPDEPRACG
jgi:streptogramin lyase